MTESGETLESPITHDEFVDLPDLAALRALYAERGVRVEGDALLQRAQRDWHLVALARAREVTETPAELPAITAEADSVAYRIYGVYHGMAGGSDRDYKAFVDRRAEALDHVLFENGLHHFYPKRSYRVIPDYAVLGVWGSLGIGLEVGKLFPLLVKEGIQDLLKRGGGIPEGSFDYSALYHGIDPETRRGVDAEDPVLPSRLQIDYEMERWDRRGALGRLADPYSIAPRSMYMAGFAFGYATSRGRAEVNLLVGDLHTMEIKRFLEVPTLRDHPLFRQAEAFGRLPDGRYRLAFLWAKFEHLFLAGATGSMIILPVMALVYLGVMWALGYELRFPG